MARAAIYAYEAQARKAGDEAADSEQAAEKRRGGAAKIPAAGARERAARLEQDLAAARRDVETQTALAAKASTEPPGLKQAAEDEIPQRCADRCSRSATGPHGWSGISRSSGSKRCAAARCRDRRSTTQDKQPRGGRESRRANQATAAAARGDAQPNPEDAAEVARLGGARERAAWQGDIGSARIVLERAAETGNAQASFALAETYDPFDSSPNGEPMGRAATRRRHAISTQGPGRRSQGGESAVRCAASVVPGSERRAKSNGNLP